MADDPTIAVLAPSLFVTITIEEGAGDDGDEIHLHPGGQAIWVARMLAHLGERPVVCTPLGGESGRALEGLARAWQIELDPVRVEAPSPAYVHDRRSGERNELARAAIPQLDRHEADNLYGRMLERSLATSVCVVTGRLAEDVDLEFYGRLGADLAAADVRVVGDLHGRELDAFLEHGRFSWLKVSAEDLAEDDDLDDESETAAMDAAERLVERGAEAVVVSRSDRPAMARLPEGPVRIEGPSLEVVDHHGAGDSMTAALAVGTRRDLDHHATLRLAWAAGAANVTRHGLGSASTDLVERLADRVTLTEPEATSPEPEAP